jgi:hypothetical protein
LVRSPVDHDGALRVVVPVGAADADRQMPVTIEIVSAPAANSADYLARLDRNAGQWQGEFECLPHQMKT